MGEMYSILRVVERWIQSDTDPKIIRRKCSVAESKTVEIELAERSYKSFLADEPVLRDLLRGIPTEHDLFEVVCTINRLVFFYVIIRWINHELWILVGNSFYIINS
ncbi:hypothetical protein ALC53_04390 [Atta colombica]|uniref:Uncharacterized protein n=1 Tax=Atta colombica TaxID=520822 RepID=A0A195BLT2_9HYME|nr:hypothetical protein ALC53_04390 [Atta colombica]